MKRLILPIIALSMLITSCIGGDVYETRSDDGYNYPDLELTTVNITVRPNQWVIDGTPGQEGTTLISEWSVREITNAVMNYGEVFVSYTFVDGQGNLVQHPLPYILPYAGSPASVMETYRFYKERGKIFFVIESSDFQCYVPEDNVDFKVSILCPR